MPFRNYIVHAVILSLFLTTGCSQKNEQLKSISGKISNLEKNYVLLSKVEDIQTKKSIPVDTIFIIENGTFTYPKKLETAIYNLTFNDKKSVQIAFVEGQQIEINGINLDSLRITGSLDTQLLLDYETYRKESLNRLVSSVRKDIKKLQKENSSPKNISELRELEVENYKKHLAELTVFIQETMGASIAIYPTSIRWNGENLDSYEEIVTNFKKEHPNTEISIKLESRINLLRKTSIGSIISNIKMPSKEGGIVQLKTVKKKYTLIDFWASWCPPCRTESSLLNNLYSKYNAIGFEIYGISLDSKRQRWVDALGKDKRIWPNVSTVEGFKTSVAQEFGITALPTNFLINDKGEIVASNIHGKHLKELIEKLFEN